MYPAGQRFPSWLWTEPQNFLVEGTKQAIADSQAVATEICQGKKQKVHSAAERKSLTVGCPCTGAGCCSNDWGKRQAENVIQGTKYFQQMQWRSSLGFLSFLYMLIFLMKLIQYHGFSVPSLY